MSKSTLSPNLNTPLDRWKLSRGINFVTKSTRRRFNPRIETPRTQTLPRIYVEFNPILNFPIEPLKSAEAVSTSRLNPSRLDQQIYTRKI